MPELNGCLMQYSNLGITITFFSSSPLERNKPLLWILMYFVYYGKTEAMTVVKMRKRKFLPRVNNNTGLVRLGVYVRAKVLRQIATSKK